MLLLDDFLRLGERISGFIEPMHISITPPLDDVNRFYRERITGDG
jgi:hypothetical protein